MADSKKSLLHTIYRHYKVEIDRKITKVIHNIPTWVFPEGFGNDIKNPCPICNHEMRKQTGHGTFIETCTIIQLDGHETMPIHTHCYDKISGEGPYDEHDKFEVFYQLAAENNERGMDLIKTLSQACYVEGYRKGYARDSNEVYGLSHERTAEDEFNNYFNNKFDL